MSLSNLFHFLTLFPFFVSFLLRCFLAASIASSSEEVVDLGVISFGSKIKMLVNLVMIFYCILVLYFILYKISYILV